MAQREGFEPSCSLTCKLISSQPRYDHFDTAAYIVSPYRRKNGFWKTVSILGISLLSAFLECLAALSVVQFKGALNRADFESGPL